MIGSDPLKGMFRKGRRTALVAFSSLAVAYVRHVLQYDEYDFGGSWIVFGGSWFLTFFAISIITAITVALAERLQGRFFGSGDTPPKLTLDQALYFVAFVALVSALVIFVIAHLPEGVADNFES